jgi:DNA-binding MarR family transcriptional regulator
MSLTTDHNEPASVGMGEVIEFMRLLWAVDHGLEASSKQMDALFGVTGPQRLVIRIVGRHPGIAAGRIAEILHVHPSTLTGVLSRLSDRGIVSRRVDPEDGRRALFSLTAQGKKLDSLRSGTVEAKVRKALGRVAPRDLVGAQRVLLSLARSLTTAAKSGPKPKARTRGGVASSIRRRTAKRLTT